MRIALLLLAIVGSPSFAQSQLASSLTSANFPPAIISNFNGGGVASANQLSTYDTAGNVIDAFQGSVQQFAGSADPNTFYRYGMGMGCGFRYQEVTTFCGFNAYSSTDLVRWTYRGQMFDPSTWQTKCANSCWEIHGAYNTPSGKYIFWFLNLVTIATPANPSGYYVIVCDTPVSGCVQATSPTISHPSHGDVNLFRDDDGTAYLVYNVSGTFVVEQLNASYTDSTGSFSQKTVNVEGMAMFKSGGNYYVTASGICPFCQGTNTYWFMASTPLGTYSNQASMSNSSCGGQQTAINPLVVNATTTLLYQSELWNANTNEGLANHFLGPVTLTGTTPDQIVCSATISVPGVNALPLLAPAGADQTDEPSPFRNICDITGTKFRLQTFVPSHTATLAKVQLPIGQNNLSCPVGGGSCPGVDGNVTISVVSLDGSNNPVSTLWSQTLTGSGLSWTPQEQTLTVGTITLTGGTKYGIQESATNTTGCFSAGYSANLPYPPGIERVSSDSGATWSTDAGASLKFSIFLN